MKRLFLGLWVGLLCLALCSCTASGNPLVKAEATAVPGMPMTLHAASASDSNVTQLNATLYFRFSDQPWLAGETRSLTVQKDESEEMAVLKALVDGPSAEKTELRRLLEGDISIEAVAESGSTVYVTLSDAFLSDAVPADWARQEAWVTEAPLRRKLTLQSIICTLTDNFPYASVQLTILPKSAAQASTRLDRSYLLTGESGPADPFTRDESLLLTAHNTAQLLLNAWAERDFETLYAFTSSYVDYEARPVYGDFCRELDAARALTDFQVSPGAVAGDGSHATLSLTLSLLRDGKTETTTAYPLRLSRENGIWKITYTTLKRMMLP